MVHNFEAKQNARKDFEANNLRQQQRGPSDDIELQNNDQTDTENDRFKQEPMKRKFEAKGVEQARIQQQERYKIEGFKVEGGQFRQKQG